MKKYEEIMHLLKTNHLQFKNDKLENTGKYTGVNISSNKYYTNTDVDKIAANNQNLTLIDFFVDYKKENNGLDVVSKKYWINYVYNNCVL